VTAHRSRRAVILIVTAALALLAAWSALTDFRAVWWPKHLLVVYANGAVHDYLAMRCIAADRLVLLGDQWNQDRLNGTWVSSYEDGATSYLAWRLDQDGRSYQAISTIFRDAEYAVTLWDPRTSQLIDEYTSSTMHGNAGVTVRHPLAAKVAASYGLQRSSTCDQSH
jgi:hypothetical protein